VEPVYMVTQKLRRFSRQITKFSPARGRREEVLMSNKITNRTNVLNYFLFITPLSLPPARENIKMSRKSSEFLSLYLKALERLIETQK
jgi:hypothetical protein